MHPERSHIASDTELLLQLSQGSKPAFDNLYHKYWKQVFNAAYKRVNNMEHAQDIAQDVFVQLWLRGTKPSIAPIENLSAYLMVAARNGVFKRMEKESKYAAFPEDTSEIIADPFNSADVGVLHKEFLSAFHQSVESLPAQQRIIFKMRFEDDLNSQEIADELQLSPKTVRNQIGKALATLKSSLLLIFCLYISYFGK